ncbi:MAG: hypothetical protein WCS57_07120 [Bacillota bacterium]|jgi:hypothetical protein|nr:hypothetical protein [Candidatus Fermentithermobacillaceae bacterium]
MSARDRILDGCDLETFIVCDAVEEGKSLGLRLMAELGFDDADVVFCEMGGPGVRIRLRGYVYRPAAEYRWYDQEADSIE